MSQTYATMPPTSSLRRSWSRLWRDPESRSTLIGIVGVVLIHLLLWLLGPRLLEFHPVPAAARPDTGREFNIELSPEMLEQTKQPEPSKFVETNPEAPENTPDKATNFAAQNQQVAQPTPTPDGTSDRPATEGKKDFESSQIVSGSLTQPIEPIPAVPPAPPTEQPVADRPAAPPRPEQNPLSGEEKFEGENKEGYGGNLAKRLENAQAVPEKIEGVPDAPLTDAPPAQMPAIDPRRPRPRPQITRQPQVRPAILSENKFGTTNIGNIAVDARWSNYGAYLQRMIDTVQIQWERIIVEQKANPVIGSSVTVKFVMNDEGRITQILNVDTTANETASRACISAITDRAPYGPWTDDMKAVLGEKQEMTFTFYYQ